MNQDNFQSIKVSEVWEALSSVCDPELDEPITELNFVEKVEVTTDYQVEISFRLPTSWCSPNFAWLMSTDIISEVGRLPWVVSVTPILRDHVYGDKINSGVTSGLEFSDVFETDSIGGIEDVRQKFALKAFQRRQETVLRGLMAENFSINDILDMNLKDLSNYEFQNTDSERQRIRYINIHDAFARGSLSAFVDEKGMPIKQDVFPKHLEKLRSIRLNMEFTGSICRSLLQVRDKSEETVNKKYPNELSVVLSS